MKSGTSSALNYGEARAAESKRDFLHKLSIVLKELRETMLNLQIIQRADLIQDDDLISTALSENNELISIFTQSIKTIQRKMQ